MNGRYVGSAYRVDFMGVKGVDQLMKFRLVFFGLRNRFLRLEEQDRFQLDLMFRRDLLLVYSLKIRACRIRSWRSRSDFTMNDHL